MFKNLITYRLGAPLLAPLEQIESALSKAAFVPCAATQPQSAGWVPPRGEAHGALVENVGGHLLLTLKTERRMLPSSVVKRRADEMAAKIEQETGRKPKGKRRKELVEEARHELLPKAFTKSAALPVWIARDHGLLMVGAGSNTRADEVVSALVEALGGIAVAPVQTAELPAACMTFWLTDGEPPAEFTIDRECELKQPDSEKASVKYARHSLEIDEIGEHIKQGKVPARLAMTFRGRVSFVMTDAMHLKRITFLDVAIDDHKGEEASDAFDADAAIATGELSATLAALIEALGGHLQPA